MIRIVWEINLGPENSAKKPHLSALHSTLEYLFFGRCDKVMRRKAKSVASWRDQKDKAKSRTY